VALAADLVRRRTGLVFPEPRRPAFEAALVTGMHRAGLADLNQYLAHMDTLPRLLDDLVAEITIGETYFFREPGQFDVIRRSLLPDLLARKREQGLRAWSAGCATGEEPYTLAIVLLAAGAEQGVRIVATDISRPALSAARRGLYSRWSLRGAPERELEDYFRPVGTRFELVPAVREAVDFQYLNLAEDTYPSLSTGIWGMDLILCRNVLIYFDAATVARVARGLIDSLSDDGWLLLGASDPQLGDLVPCDVVITDAGLAYRRPGRRGVGLRAESPDAAAFATWPGSEIPAWQLPVETPAVPSPTPAPVPVGGEGDAMAAGLPAALRFYRERDYGRAAEVAAACVRDDGNEPGLWIVLVRALANRGALEEAGRMCIAALDRYPSSAELMYLHAVVLGEAGRLADAAAAARRALYLDRNLVVAHLALGVALTRLGDLPAARRSFANAARLLDDLPPDAVVPACDGEPAGRLAEISRAHLQLLAEPEP
jgi:chemotaxis protein methyltransferase CheR